jgi:PLP dependent protein
MNNADDHRINNGESIWVLGSASPRRQHLLKFCGQPFKIQASNVNERQEADELPQDFALRMAEEKALNVAKIYSNSQVVIGGDTVVALGTKILGKPSSTDEAKATLLMLSGCTHEVWSGWAIARCNEEGQCEIRQSGVALSQVTMRELTETEILAYIDDGEPLDKAGSYGIQGKGGRFVVGLKGSFFAVIGLPMIDLFNALEQLGEIRTELDLLRRGIQVRERTAQAAWRSGRVIESVEVLAVSKKHSVDRIKYAQSCLFTHFGENYYQELIDKSAYFDEETEVEPHWHYIGAIQSRKARRIGATAQWVHGLTRYSEADKLSQGAMSVNHVLKAMIQVNLSSEKSKGGIPREEVGELLAACQSLEGIKVVGLMTFPPLALPEENRPYFRALRELRDDLEREGYSLPHLSMGTSDDFEVAIEEGATWVRLGRSLFGSRTDH